MVRVLGRTSTADRFEECCCGVYGEREVGSKRSQGCPLGDS